MPKPQQADWRQPDDNVASSGSDRFQSFCDEQWHRCFDTKDEWERYCEEKGIEPYPDKVNLDKHKKRKE